jgi:hypothetical protein
MSSTSGCPVFSTPFVEEAVFSLTYIFRTFVENQMVVTVLVYNWIFYSIPLLCFCTSTMLFLLLWLCSIVWIQVLWYLQHCSFCSGLLWVLEVFCASTWVSGLFFLFLWKQPWKIYRDFIESVDCFW